MGSDVKAQMSIICKELGITTSTAFNLFANAFIMIWITADNVIPIPSHIIRTIGRLDSLQNRADLEAAIVAPLQSFGSEELLIWIQQHSP